MPFPVMAVMGSLGGAQGLYSSLTSNKKNRKFAKLQERNLASLLAQQDQSSAFAGGQIGRQMRAAFGSTRTSLSERGIGDASGSAADVETAIGIQGILEQFANITSSNNEKQATYFGTKSRIDSLEHTNPFLAAITGAINGIALSQSIFGSPTIGGPTDGTE